MKTYTIPVDIKLVAESAHQAEMDAINLMKVVYMDHKHTFNLVDYEFPVDFPIDEDNCT